MNQSQNLEGNDMEADASTKKNRRSLVALFGIGFFPLIISWLIFFYFPELMPSGTTNEGQLINPPVHASQIGIEDEIGEWTLLVPVGTVCDEGCMERLYLARQVNVALGKEAPRVHRLLLSIAPNPSLGTIKQEYPDMDVVPVEGAGVNEQLVDPNQIFLMDPLGNIFMAYNQEKAGKPMLKDIKHLLKISKLG